MPGWGKLVAGAVLGAAGALYATNEEFRKQLPDRARELPKAVRRRFEAASAAAREASARRRAEILHELEAHGGSHAGRELPLSQDTPSVAIPSGEPTTRTEDI